MIRVLDAVVGLAAVSLAGLYGIGWWMRATARTEELDLGPMRQRESFVSVMDRYTRSPK